MLNLDKLRMINYEQYPFYIHDTVHAVTLQISRIRLDMADLKMLGQDQLLRLFFVSIDPRTTTVHSYK